jgi:hypothetical protein
MMLPEHFFSTAEKGSRGLEGGLSRDRPRLPVDTEMKRLSRPGEAIEVAGSMQQPQMGILKSGQGSLVRTREFV